MCHKKTNLDSLAHSVRQRRKIHTVAPSIYKRIIWTTLYGLLPITKATWFAVDHLYSKYHPPYMPLELPYGIIRFRSCSYRGAPRTVGNDILEPGDRMLELHINSPVAQALHRKHINPYTALDTDMAHLARWIKDNDLPYKAIHSRNILPHLMQHIGATDTEHPLGLRPVFEQLFEEMAILIFHPKGLLRLKRKHTPIADSWVPRTVFMALYGVHP